jgi:outer membrane receptor protein involved in Fe transport
LLRGISPSLSFMDSLSLQRGRHYIRFGGEIRRSWWQVHGAVDSYGEVHFASFQDFLTGNTAFSALGTGFSHLDLRTTDYHLFAQDDWKVTPRLTLSLGLRYELNPPPYEFNGLLGGFDPTLYRPRMQVDADGFPLGPPAGGIIEAGNAPLRYSLTGVTRVDDRLLKSSDPLNFAPRLGVSWSPLASGRLAVHASYGLFYSRPSFL